MSFAEMGHFDPLGKYFVYECDEYDRNFLSFHPEISLISGVDWDHADIYPTREDYYQAFRDFLNQCATAVLWLDDAKRLSLAPSADTVVLDVIPKTHGLTLAGAGNRADAWLAIQAFHRLVGTAVVDLVQVMNRFPGVSRRFEALQPGLYTDYAHTPKKILGALQLAHEVAGDNIVVVYEGLHNTRQHFIKNELAHLFDSVKKLYVVPSYLAREDPALAILTPDDIIALTSQPAKAEAADLNEKLKTTILQHLQANDLVLILSAGGGGSLDEWLHQELA